MKGGSSNELGHYLGGVDGQISTDATLLPPDPWGRGYGLFYFEVSVNLGARRAQ